MKILKSQPLILRAIFVALLALASSAAAQRSSFEGARAFSYIEELCKPGYAGRFTGHPGAAKAAGWIGAQFAQWGLTPAGDDDGWLQTYPMIVTEQLERAKLRLTNGAFGPVEYQEGNDFTVYMNSGSGNVTAEVVFAGFGISEPAMGRDDYAGIAAAGKILLLYRGLPADEQDWSFANERDYKMRAAAAHGAAGLLMLDRDDWPIRGGTIHEEGYYPNLPACNISKKVARDIFHGTFKDLDLILRDLPKKPNSMPLARTLKLQVKMKQIEHGKGENVVAVIHGSDPVLRKEYIVIGGHMDHNGFGKDGHLYPGADDNASGAAVVMELARVFAAMPEKPKRSLLFVDFGGEEQGLRGSKYFAYHPPVPAGQIAVMLNFDMEGAGDGGASMGGRNYLPRVLQTMAASWSDSILAKTRFGRGWGGSGSDHFHFIEQGIPAFYFSSTGGHSFYHQMEDQPSTLNVASLQSVGDRAIALIQTLANWQEPLTFDGARSGRFFVRHGDQLDLCGCAVNLEKELEHAVLTAHDSGIHFTTLSLSSADARSGRLFSRLDSLDQWIAGHPVQLIRYENGSSIDRAAGQAKLAVGVSLRGTAAMGGSAATLRQLGRLGLNLMTIDDPADPLFAGSQLAADAQELLQVAQSANLLLHIDLADTVLVDAVKSGFTGRILWSLDLPQAAALKNALVRRLANGRSLLILRCAPGDDQQQLLELALALPADRLHISILGDSRQEELLNMPLFVSTLHKLLTAKVGGEQSYKLMEKWFGRNVKKILVQ